ncbi:prohead protease/major capsid protein fusion protein [Caulobacter vibrioides]|uniref:prohead protease/major capsid protein fusion protein n=1 Tax=Caulobacter vibrioides TaxID=155892 RepID=UPI000BB4F9A8|nr:prohead protease/major capsid protein fusion protein [Caulobacter vibrioides]ATC25204.1 peptidase [Caulobacter vibrioides]PLR13974.1 peptidase [Caulobacter vibrioides]
MTRSALPARAEDRRSAPPDHHGTRLATFNGSSYDAANRTVEAVLSVGARVRRWFGFEELSMDARAVDLARVAMGQVRLLDSHNQWDIDAVLGVVVTARVQNGQLVGTLKFADTERARIAEGMVSRGELTGISIGYNIRAWRLVEIDANDNEIWQASEWELLEASLVSVPADPNAGVRSAAAPPGSNPSQPNEDPDMATRNQPGAPAAPAAPAPAEPAARAQTPPAAPAPADPAAVAAPEVRAAPAAPAAPAASAGDANAVRMSGVDAIDFTETARSFGFEGAQVRNWVENMTPQAARDALLSAAAERQRAAAPLAPAMSAGRVTVDERDTMRSAITSALLHRFNPSNELSEPGREFRGMSLLEICRRNLERNGERVAGLGRREIADLALRQHSTSDFPNILGNVTGRTLRGAYEASPRTFTQWQRRATAPDFKQVTRLQMGGAPSLLAVPEGGEFKMGTIGEAKEVYALATYGRRFSVTRQTIINDDLDAFTRIPTLFGRAAADFESDAAYAPLISNPNMGDNIALFHASHGNLAGAGAAISETSVQNAEIAFGAQTGIEGRPINVLPRWMIVATKDRVPALKLRGSTGSQAANSQPNTTNVYQNAFDVIVEARLSRASGAVPWFMAADNAQIDTIEYCYLEGDDGVYLEERNGFEVDGIEYKARLDFAVKAIDYRGLYMNPGT